MPRLFDFLIGNVANLLLFSCEQSGMIFRRISQVLQSLISILKLLLQFLSIRVCVDWNVFGVFGIGLLSCICDLLSRCLRFVKVVNGV